MKGKLNIFQRTMLLWNEIHPYNAVNLVRIPQPLNLARLEDIIKRHLERYSLMGLVICRKKKRFHYHGGSTNIEIKVIEGQENALAALYSEIQKQLNMPFKKIPPRPPLVKVRGEDFKVEPFRFFAVKEGDSFYLGLVYFHLISGDDSIIFLLKSIVNFYMDKNASGLCLPLNLYPMRYRYPPPINLKSMIGWIFSLPGYIANLRKSFRPRYSDINDHNIGFSYFRIEPSQFQSLVRTAKRLGVTLNDMFLAILMKSISPLASKRWHSSRRKKISIASIINIRKDLSADNPGIFGLFLSSFSVTHIVPDGIPLEQLVKDIHKQTVKIKKHKLYLRTIMEMGAALVLLRYFFSKRKEKFYPKYYPLWGGITNINLNSLWKMPDNKIPVDYLRAVSTGHATPLVFSFTTVNDVLNIGVSFRTTVFSDTDIEKIMSNFSNCIYNLN